MKPKSLHHLSHYIILLILMIVGLVALILFSGTTFSHTAILVLIASAYFIWGVTHQYLENELYSETVMEYLLFSLLGLALGLGVLYYF